MTIPAGYAEVTLEMTGSAVPTGAAITFGVDNTASDFGAVAIAGIVDAAIVSELLFDRLSANLALTNIHVKKGPDSTGPFADVGSTIVGGSPGDSNPATALLVNKVTAQGGRKNRGRWFLPGVIEADVDQGGVIDPTGLTAFQTQHDDFLVQIAGAGIPMVILHRDTSLPTTVTDLQVSSLLGRQGRRLRRT